MDRRDVAHWIGAYERAWRMPGTEDLQRLFAPEATYSPGPYADTITGLEAIEAMWEAERRGPDEDFTMTSALVALDDHVAVARVEVHYRYEGGSEWRDLWVMCFDEHGLCTAFEEWPFAPDRAGA